MSEEFDRLKQEILDDIAEIKNLKKKLHKRQLPSNYEDTLAEYLDKFNEISGGIDTVYEQNLTPLQKEYFKKLFDKVIDKTVSLFGYHKWNIKVPHGIGEQISRLVVNSEDESELTEEEEDEEEDDEEDDEMVKTAEEVFTVCAKALFPYSGEPSSLQSFLDALDTCNKFKDAHEDVVIGQIKSSLRGAARALITNQATIAAIKDILQREIVTPTSDELITKLNSVDPRHKQPKDYADEIEGLANQLKQAFISEQIPVANASRLSADAAKRAITSKSTDREVNTVMRAATLETVASVTAKYLQVKTSQQEQQVLFYNARGRGAKRFQKNHHQRNNHRNNNYHNRQNNNRPNNNSFSRGQPRGQRGRGGNRRYYVRPIQEGQGNLNGPQMGEMH